jgi:hypothetical protein
MAQIKIAVVNESTSVKDADVVTVVAALQAQVHDHFAPAWGIDADLEIVPKGVKPPPGAWWLIILDDADQAGALGFHDVTDDGLPMGKVFARTTTRAGGMWTVTASHELLEMLADPEINLTVFVQNGSAGRLYAYEVCDACEDDRFGYTIGHVLVADFVYPAWFESSRKKNSTQFDHRGHLHQPLPALLPGGYIGVFDVTSGSGWQQLTADPKYNYSARPRVGSRRERRRTPREQWQASDAFTPPRLALRGSVDALWRGEPAGAVRVDSPM